MIVVLRWIKSKKKACTLYKIYFFKFYLFQALHPLRLLNELHEVGHWIFSTLYNWDFCHCLGFLLYFNVSWLAQINIENSLLYKNITMIPSHSLWLICSLPPYSKISSTLLHIFLRTGFTWNNFVQENRYRNCASYFYNRNFLPINKI